MRRIVSAAVVVSLVSAGLLISAVPSASAAPPTVSVTSGAPGTVVEISAADCETEDPDGDVFMFLGVRLLSGTAPDEVLAGAGGSELGVATVVIPDWVDPADPASIEATCTIFDFEEEEPLTTAYDPVAFDVLPGVGAPTQLRTYSRTSLMAGQAFEVEGEGCNLPDAEWAAVDVFVEADLSGRSFAEIAAFGGGELDGTDYLAQAVLSNGYVSLSVGFEGDPPVLTDLEVEEEPTVLPPGEYTAVSYCADEDGNSLLYEPQLITITGDAPIGDIDLTASEAGDRVTLEGTSCTSGPVEVFMEALPLDDFGEFEASPVGTASVGAARPIVTRSGIVTTEPVDAAARQRPAGSWPSTRSALHPQGLPDDQYLEATVDPDESGVWSISDDTGFEQGAVLGYALCGDPLAAGWYYDPQGVGVQAEVVTPPPPPPPPPAAPPAAPEAVPASPHYAG
jgi:hypothetical protein